MTAQVDTYTMENDCTNVIGQEWQKLFDLFSNKEPEKPFDGGGNTRQYRSEDSNLRSLHDVKRLRHKDMSMFGRSPETDLFYTVVCSICSMILIPQALKHHIQKRHGDPERLVTNNNINEKLLESPLKSKSKKVAAVAKPEIKVEKQRKLKSTPSSPPDLTDEITKERRSEKSKKSKVSPERTVPPELEPMTILPISAASRTDKRKQKLVATSSTDELQPIVALSPIKVAEKAGESEEKDTPKKSKKKEKTDKVYDPNKHCGVPSSLGKPCLRSILCKVHQVALKRAVLNRSMPYDALIKLIKSQNEDEKKVDNELLKPKMEVVPELKPAPPSLLLPPEIIAPPIASRVADVKPHNLVTLTVESVPMQILQTNTPVTKPTSWSLSQPQTDHIKIKTEEPATKRMKMKEAEEEIDPNPYVLSSELDALIEQTLKDVEASEPLPLIPVVPKPEPILRWSTEPPSPRKSSTPPPHIDLEDVHWHTSHPKPLAVNTFGCRIIGGLMSTCKKLDSLRKHLQNVWSSSTSTIKNSLNDIYTTNNSQSVNSAIKNNFTPVSNKFIKLKVNKSANVTKKNVIPVAKTVSTKRKRKSSTIAVQNTTTASDIISGLLIGNAVPIQRSATVPTTPSGVIPVNTINGNGVPLRLFQGSLPVIASTAPNQPATFIQLNLCPPK